MTTEFPEKNRQLYKIAAKFQQANSPKEALQTFLFIVAIDPQDQLARTQAAKILIGMDHITERAQARDLLEEGFADPDIGLSSEATYYLMQIYRSIGPLEKSLELLQARRDQMAEIIDQPSIESLITEMTAELETEVDGGANKKRIRRALYPDHEAFNGPLYNLFEGHILNDFDPGPVTFGSSDSVLTMGSCFAERISALMNRRGLNAYNLGLPETVNTTHANRDFIGYLAGGVTPNADFWDKELRTRTQDKGDVAEKIKAAKVIVYTLGVAPAFFSNATSEFVPHSVESFKTRRFPANNTFRMTTVQENVDNLTYIFDQMTKLNPDFSLVLTVSPVPLRATFERGSAVISDCVSKSTLRIAAEEFCAVHKDRVAYWPSFEMIKWVSPHREPFYGTDDAFSHHISDEVVSVIVEAFLKKCLRDDA